MKFRGIPGCPPFRAAVRMLATCILLGAMAPGMAQEQAPIQTDQAAETRAPDGDPLGRDTPKSSFYGFLKAAEAFDWETAEEYLDLRNLPQKVRTRDGTELAQQFYFILQRRGLEIDGELLSTRQEGQVLDDLPDYRDELARINTMDGEVTLLMQHVPGPEEGLIWKVSNATMARVPDLYEEFSYPDWVESVRQRVPGNYSLLGVELYKWIIVLGFVVILIPLGWLFAVGLAMLTCNRQGPLYPYVRRILAGPILALSIAIFAGQLLLELGIGATAGRVMEARTLTTVFTVWLIWTLADLWRARRRNEYEASGRTDASVLGRPLANAVKLISLILGTLFWLANAGVDITALLAGLGIGGVALALALQKPIEDLFGAVSIYSQQPLKTGDFVKYQGHFGVVEEVGLRTTGFRTLSNTLVHVPNSQLAYGIIENITSRQKIMYHPDLPLRFDTTRAQVEGIIEDLYAMLRANPGVEQDSIRVRLVSFKENAINLRMRIFATTTSFDEYLEIIEQVNLAIMDIVESRGAHFAQGARTLFVESAD